MTEEDLKAIEELWSGTTHGVWGWYGGDVVQDDGNAIAVCSNDNDALAIVSAPTDIAELIAEIRRLHTLQSAVQRIYAIECASRGGVRADYAQTWGDAYKALIDLLDATSAAS